MWLNLEPQSYTHLGLSWQLSYTSLQTGSGDLGVLYQGLKVAGRAEIALARSP